MKIKKEIAHLLVIITLISFSASSFAQKYGSLDELKMALGEDVYNALSQKQTKFDNFYKKEDTELLELLNTPYYTFSGGIEELHEKIEDLLEKGADPQRISKATSKEIYNKYIGFPNPQKTSKTCRWGDHVFCNNDLQAKTIELLFENKENPLHPDHFLRLLLKSNLKNEKSQELIELALKNKADPNSVLVYSYINKNASEQTIKLLFENDYKKIKPDLFKQFFKIFNLKQMLNKYGLNEFYSDPDQYFNARYKNLSDNSASGREIPKSMHQVWLTNELEKREIPPYKLIDVLNMQHDFSNNKEQEWKHIVWTNNENLIPHTVKILKEHNIEVKNISELNKHLGIREEIYSLIKHGRFGTAADLARFVIVAEKGGFYTDVDVDIDVDSADEIRKKYDFFGITDTHGSEIDPYYFAAMPDHPILTDTINLLSEHFKDLSSLASELGEKGLERTTMYNNITTPILDHNSYLTVIMLDFAYHRTANKNGTIDAVSSPPPNSSWRYIAEFPSHWAFNSSEDWKAKVISFAEYLELQNPSDFVMSGKNPTPFCFNVVPYTYSKPTYLSDEQENFAPEIAQAGESKNTWRKNGFDRVL